MRAPRKMTPEKIEVARLMLAGGMSYGAVAREIGVTDGRTIEKYLPGYRRWHWEHLTDEQIRRAEALIADGCSLSEVARTLDVTYWRVWRVFHGQGWTSEQTNEYRRMLRELDPDDHQRDWLAVGAYVGEPRRSVGSSS